MNHKYDMLTETRSTRSGSGAMAELVEAALEAEAAAVEATASSQREENLTKYKR